MTQEVIEAIRKNGDILDADEMVLKTSPMTFVRFHRKDLLGNYVPSRAGRLFTAKEVYQAIQLRKGLFIGALSEYARVFKQAGSTSQQSQRQNNETNEGNVSNTQDIQMLEVMQPVIRERPNSPTQMEPSGKKPRGAETEETQ